MEDLGESYLDQFEELNEQWEDEVVWAELMGSDEWLEAQRAWTEESGDRLPRFQLREGIAALLPADDTQLPQLRGIHPDRGSGEPARRRAVEPGLHRPLYRPDEQRRVRLFGTACGSPEGGRRRGPELRDADDQGVLPVGRRRMGRSRALGHDPGLLAGIHVRLLPERGRHAEDARRRGAPRRGRADLRASLQAHHVHVAHDHLLLHPARLSRSPTFWRTCRCGRRTC